ncbi:unnamed protein product, partial [Scytosiphon promiscuus]
MPSVEVEKPKKGVFGSLFGSSKAKVEVPGVDVTAPDVSSDARRWEALVWLLVCLATSRRARWKQRPTY